MNKTKLMALVSALALILSVITLNGTTIAYFTEEDEGGYNLIRTGTLDVEAYHASVSQVEYKEIEAGDPLFLNKSGERMRWEPGLVTYENIKVVNEGDLAFQYRLSMNYEDVNALLDPNGMHHTLSQVLKVGLVEGGVTATTREEALAAVSEWMPLNQFRFESHMLAKEEKTLGVIVWWQPSAQDNNYNANNGKTLSDNSDLLKIDLGVKVEATQYAYESDALGNDYDKDAKLPEMKLSIRQSVSVKNENGYLAEEVVIEAGQVRATIPAGTKLADTATTVLTLVVESKDDEEANIQVDEEEDLNAMEVRVEGVSKENDKPIEIYFGEIAPKNMNIGPLSIYHEQTKMTSVAAGAAPADNQFKYDPATGEVTIYIATFSEVALVTDEQNTWGGVVDTDWYINAAGEEDAGSSIYYIANADQLAGLGKLVSEGNNFENQTVKLIADVNFGGVENYNSNDRKVLFYPIGYNKVGGTTTDKGDWYTYGGAFSGEFDGMGHTVSGIYQNTWAMVGNYDGSYYNAAMGLFGYINGGTVKNLTIDNFYSEGEFAPTGCVAAYAAGTATFENIAITNSHPQTYNTGVAGIVGWDNGGDTEGEASNFTFKNITVDSSNTISALWGSWDVAAAGLLGYLGEYSKAVLDNCHVSATIDVYNDVCGNYQYYWYRYCGMLIGTVDKTKADGSLNLSNVTAKNCSVEFGDRHEYYYCEFVDNSIASYTHDYQFSRVPEGDIQIINNVAVCNHDHDERGTETVNGVEVLVEDKQAVYIPFYQLFGGYGWGVDGVSLEEYNDLQIEVDRKVTDSDIENSVQKFVTADSAQKEYAEGKTVNIGELFTENMNKEIDIPVKNGNVQVFVSPVGETSTAGGIYTADNADWKQGTLKFRGTGAATISISDFYYCKTTTIEVTITERVSVQKFVSKFTGNFLYRVGNQNTVALGSLFKAKDGVNIGTVDVTIETLSGTAASDAYTPNATWTNGTIQFSGTGVVKVTITDNDYCTPTELKLEVVDAKNTTTAASATANNVVLLNDISGTFTVSNGHTFYGNGFTVKLPTTSVQNVGNGFTGYISIGASQDSGSANGGHLDNVRIEGPVYPEMYIYRDQAKITDTNDPDYGDGYNMRYFKNSVIVYGGNCTISNSYISGSRTALCLRGGNNVLIDNTTLSGGSYANLQICAGSKVALRNLTTVQVDETDSYGKGKTAHGLGIAVDSSVVDLYIEGELKQYNWLNQTQWNSIVPSTYQSAFPKFFTDSSFSKNWHYLNGGTDPYVNMAFIFACNWDTSKIHDNRTTVDYATTNATIAGVSGGVYSKVNTVGGDAIMAADLKDPGYTSPGFNPVAPVFTFDNTANNEADDENDAGDTYCVYDEASGTLKIGVTGDSKTLDLSGVSVKKSGTTLAHTANLNGKQISGNSVTIKAADGAKQTLTFKATSNDAGYDKDGNPIEGSIEYTWTVTVEIAVLSYPAPVWNMGSDYQFDTSNCVYAYYSTSQGYGEAVPIYEGIKVNYYNKSGTLVNLDLSGTTTLPTGSANSNSNAFTYTLADGSTLTMKFSSGWKSGATTHQFTTYNNKVYIYPQSLDNDNYVRAKTTNQDFDVKITYNFTDPNGQSTGDQTMQWYNAKASNGSVSTVQWKTFDSTNGKKASVCVTSDTLVTLADGSKKEIQYVTYEDQLLVWDFYKGEYTTAPVSLLVSHGDDRYQVITLTFDDGTDVNFVGCHGLFDVDCNEFVDINAENAESFIGHRALKQDGSTFKVVTLVDAEVSMQDTGSYTILSADHHNAVLNDLLTVSPSLYCNNLYEPFEIGEGMKYDEAQMQADIEQYGLYTYEEFADYLTQEQFDAFNIANMKVSAGKGNVTYETIIELLGIVLP